MKKEKWRNVKNQNNKPLEETLPKVNYAGFWSRVLGFVIDIFMIGLPVTFIIMALFGYEQMQSVSTLDVLQGIKPLDANGEEIKPNPMIALTQIGLFATAVILLWRFDGGRTPGKRLSSTKVVDAKTLKAPALWQLIVRFFAYFLSFITILGFLLPLIHPRKIALHDLLASTAVIYDQQ